MEVDGTRRDCCAGLITVGAAMVCNEEASGQPYALHWGGYYTAEHTTLRTTERTSLGDNRAYKFGDSRAHEFGDSRAHEYGDCCRQNRQWKAMQGVR